MNRCDVARTVAALRHTFTAHAEFRIIVNHRDDETIELNAAA